MMLYHRTGQATARTILHEGFRDAPVTQVGRPGVWFADCALDLDHYVVLHRVPTWALCYAVTGGFSGWLHLLVFDRSGGLRTLAPFHKTPLAPPGEAPPFLFDAMVTMALGAELRDYGLARLMCLGDFPRIRLAHPSQLMVQHGNGPRTSLLGVAVPDPIPWQPWEVPAPPTQTWREWLVPAAVLNALGPPTLFGDESSDAAFGPLDPALFLPAAA